MAGNKGGGDDPEGKPGQGTHDQGRREDAAAHPTPERDCHGQCLDGGKEDGLGQPDLPRQGSGGRLIADANDMREGDCDYPERQSCQGRQRPQWPVDKGHQAGGKPISAEDRAHGGRCNQS